MTPHFLRLDRSRRMAIALALALAGAVLGALLAVGSGTTATAQAPTGGKTVSAVGLGQVNVNPKDRNNNASIVEAVEASEAKAIPQAVAAARERAAELAKAGGLTLGAVQSVEEVQQQFPFYGPGAPPPTRPRSARTSTAATSAGPGSSATPTGAGAGRAAAPSTSAGRRAS
jgi:uncharacterized protein YggE